MTYIPLNHAVKYQDRWLQITMLFLINYMKHIDINIWNIKLQVCLSVLFYLISGGKMRHKRQALQDMARPLKQWLYKHRDNPYPTKTEKILLALGSHMTLVQVRSKQTLTWDETDIWSDQTAVVWGSNGMDLSHIYYDIKTGICRM